MKLPEKTVKKIAASSGKWRPGETGNARGRPRGSGQAGRLRDAIAGNLPEIIKALVRKAINGDPQAAKLLLERTLPALRPTDLGVALPVAGETLSEKGEAVFASVLKGEITPTQGQTLLSGLNALAAVRAIDDLERRIAALESNDGDGS